MKVGCDICQVPRNKPATFPSFSKGREPVSLSNDRVMAYHTLKHRILGLREMNTFRGDNSVKIFCSPHPPSEKQSTLKGKNLLPMGANSSLFE